ncbi:EsaB/YukD family protein [Alkaliphilus transvaalensis]|uniref:EsaB/YukD family protein n=1 Tax=Alkaliphilus transvaalensis TaxID=114628 RepID=UPI00047A7AC0|nr:EsaB/YukD family protein [Alkaliphilus transvaalensis]
MDYIIVTFKQNNSTSIDLKIPTFVPIRELLTMLADTLNVEAIKEKKLQAEPLGHILDNNLTLEEEGVSNGALLTVV